LVASGALTSSTIQLVVARGECDGPGRRGCPRNDGRLLAFPTDGRRGGLPRAEGDVWVANYNAPGQVVIAGPEKPSRCRAHSQELGAKKVMPIQVSAPSHPTHAGGPRPPAQGVAEAHVMVPAVRVVANVDARVHDDPGWPALLSAQRAAPVRWRQTLETFRRGSDPSLVSSDRARAQRAGQAEPAEIPVALRTKPDDSTPSWTPSGVRDLCGRTRRCTRGAPLLCPSASW